ncbi:MAG: hypothetical protein QM786_09350 [Breznakibacter sp.]
MQKNDIETFIKLAGGFGTLDCLSETYCSNHALVELYPPSSWTIFSATTHFVWTVETTIDGLEHPDWITSSGSGLSEEFHFDPTKVPSTYFATTLRFTIAQRTSSNTTITTLSDISAVLNSPAVFTFGSDIQICSGSSGVLTLSGSESGVRYYLLQDGTNVTFQDGTGSPISFSVSSAGTYTVNARNVSTSCDQLMNGAAVVTVNPLPSATASNNGPLCIGESLQLTGGANGLTAYTWSGPNSFTSTLQSPAISTVTAAMAGTYTLTVTDANGCKQTATTNLVVNTLPSISADDKTICAGQSATLSINSPDAGYTYHWNTGATGTSITVTPTATTTYTVYARNTTTGCESLPIDVTVTVNPLPVPTISGPTTACVGTSGTYTTEGGMSGYTWTVIGGSVTSGSGTNSVQITWSTSGTQNVTVNYTNSNGCTATAPATRTVTVNPLPVPTISGPTAACVGTSGTYATEGGMSGYTWTVTGGSVTSGSGTNSVQITWGTSGTQNVTVNYTNSNGCTATAPATRTVTVNPLPVPTISGPTTACVGTSGTYTTEGGMSGYTWTVTGGTITTGGATNTIQVSWGTSGTQTVTVNYVNSNSCTAATATARTVTVNPLPVPTISGPTTACVGTIGTYTTEGGMSGYTWTVTGGSVTSGSGTNSVQITWSTSGTQSVTVNYTNSNGCTATAPATRTVTVNPLPVPTISGPTAACVGTSGTYATEGGMSGYTWTVTGGSVTSGSGTNSVQITWGTSGTQNVTVNYTNSNGCTATIPAVRTVTVSPLPTPTISGVSSTCVGSSETYTTESGMTGYVWTVSTGGTITSGQNTNNITINWTTSGNRTVTVTYVNANGCSPTSPTSRSVTVNSLPAPTITGLTSTCVGATTTYATESGMTGYTWTVSTGGTIASGQGTSSITVDWSTTGSKTITVTYVNANGCSPLSPTSHSVTVNPLPVPTISGPTTACVGTSGTYTTEGGMSGYTWTVTGGSVTSGSGTNSVQITWSTSGTQNVTVNYTNSNGCTATAPATRTVTVNPLPVPTISGPTAACVGTSGTYATEGGMSGYTWTVTGGSVTSGSGTNSVQITWGTSGTQNVTVNYTNSNGCTATAPATRTVTVNPLPVPTISGPTTACVGTSGTYTTEGGMSGYTWTVTGGTITTGGATNTIQVSWGTSGTQTVTVNYVNSNSCTAATATARTVTVNPLPVPTISGPTTACVGTIGTYTTEGGMSGYTWTVTGGSVTSGSGTNSVQITWSTSGTQSVTVNYTNSNGCTATAPATRTVTVNPLPVPTISGPTAACVGTSGTYATEGGMSGYTWTVTGGSVTSGSGTNSVQITWGTSGTQNVTVNYTNSNGCTATIPAVRTVTVSDLSVSLSVNPPASPTNTKVCIGETITYQATATAGSGSYNYQFEQRLLPSGAWASVQNGASNFYVTSNGLAAGQYELRVTVTDLTTGCSAIQTASSFEVIALPSITLSTSDSQLCENETLVLTANPTGFSNYIFNIDGTSINNGSSNVYSTNTLSVGAHTAYVTATNSGGCSASSTPSLSIQVDAIPSVNLVSDKASGVACINETVTFTASGAAQYQFYVNGSATGSLTANPIFTHFASDDFVVEVVGFNAAGCSDSASISITISKPVATLSVSSSEICASESVTFTAMGGSIYTFYEGTNVVQGPSALNTYTSGSITNGQIFTVIAENIYGCTSTASNAIIMTVNPVPTASVVSDKAGNEVCAGSPIVFTASSDIGDEFEFYVNGAVAQVRQASSVFTSSSLVNGDVVHVVAYISSTDCNTQSTSLTVTVNDLPSVSISASPGLSIIENTPVTFTATVLTGAVYQWSVNGTVVKAFSTDNTFTSSTLADNDQVSVVIRDLNGCENTATVTMSVFDTVVPQAVVASPEGYCTSSATGSTISITTTQAGVVYELYRENGATDVLIGTVTSVAGEAIAWNNINNGGIGTEEYYVIAYHSSVPSVKIEMSNRVNVTEYAKPVKHTMAPTGIVTDCNSGVGYEIKLLTSTSGVRYTLYKDNSPWGGSFISTGGELSFGSTTTGGVYTVVAELVGVDACSEVMDGSFTIDLTHLGTQYNLLSSRADGLFCEGGTGVRIYLDGTENGINYILKHNGSTVATVTGNGNAMNFGYFTDNGTYTAEVLQDGCSLNMLGTVTVTQIDLPVKYNLLVANGGHYCMGSTGVEISLSGQQNGVTYELYRDGSLLSSFTGTGSGALSFGTYNVTGSYYVEAYVSTLNCHTSMNNTVTLTADPLAEEVNFISAVPGNVFCENGDLELQITNSRSGTDYYLLLDGTETGDVVSGNDGLRTFTVSQAGVYGLKALRHNATTDCETILASTIVVSETLLPETRVVRKEPGTGTACDNGAVFTVVSSQNGIQYELYRNSAATGSIVTGSGSDVSFAPVVDANGTYSVKAIASPGSCSVDLTPDDPIVAIPGVVQVFNVTKSPAGNLCAGDLSGYTFSMSGSETGVLYILSVDGTDVETFTGNGSAFAFVTAATTEGTYTVRAYNPVDPTCVVPMAGTYTVAYHSLPFATLSSNAGTTIVDGTNVEFMASGGIEYQFFINGTEVRVRQGLETFSTNTLVNGDVVSVNVYDANGCVGTASLTITVLDELLQLQLVADPTGYCTTSSGTMISVRGIQSGVTYELFRESDNYSLGTGTIIGSWAVWNNVKNLAVGVETYYAVAYYSSLPAATLEMANRVTVTEYALPAVFNLSPTGTETTCQSYTLSLDGSEADVLYTLWRNGVPVQPPITGAGGSIAFSPVNIGGTYSVTAQLMVVTGCSVPMNGTFTLDLSALGQPYNLLSDRTNGQYCADEAGVRIYLENSTAGSTYQLFYKPDASSADVLVNSVTGIGSSIDFGMFTNEGYYWALVDYSGCYLAMDGTVIVEKIELPIAQTLSADNNGHFCADDAVGISIWLDGQENGVTYNLFRNGTELLETVVSNLIDPSDNLVFSGKYNTTGTYSVVAEGTGIGCINYMANTIALVKEDLPETYHFIAESSTYCTGSSTVLYIPDSQTGTVYQLVKDGVPVAGTEQNGTGSRIDFTVSAEGLYKILAVRQHTDVSCPSMMDDAGGIVVTEAELPEDRLISWIDGTDCENGTIITVHATQTGITYFVYSATTGQPLPGYVISGNGNDIPFDDIVDNGGTYYVVAQNAAGCQAILTPDVPVAIVGAIKKQPLTIPSSICLGDNGVTITLDDSEAGVMYTLYSSNGVLKGSQTGDGSSLAFAKVYDEGEYYVIGQNATAPTCPNEMLNRVTIQYNPLPTSFRMTGSGFYCGTISDVQIGLENSEWEVTYTLLYHAADGLKFAGNEDGLYGGGAITFANVLASSGYGNGLYTVYATSSQGCTSSMEGQVTVEQKNAPAPFSVDPITAQYCSAQGGVDVYLSQMEAGVTYSIENISTTPGSVETIIGSTNTTNALLVKLQEGTYRINASWGGDACIVWADNTVTITMELSPSVPELSVSSDECQVSNSISVTNAESGVTYELWVNDESKGTDTVDDGEVKWEYTGTSGQTQSLYVLAYLTNINCGVKSNVYFVETKDAPAVFGVTPETGTYCEGEAGVTIGLTGSEADVLYELLDESNVRIDYYIPKDNEVGNAISFDNPIKEGIYRVRARFMTGGCVMEMIGEAVVSIDESGSCIPIIAVDDYMALGDNQVSDTVNVALSNQDIWNPNIDTYTYQEGIR